METTKEVAQPANGHLNPAEAKAILQQEAQQRAEACKAEIGKVLDKYQCKIDVVVLLRENQVTPQIQILTR